MWYNTLGYEVAQEQHNDLLREAQKYALVQQALAAAGAGRNLQSILGRMARLFGRPAGGMHQGSGEQRPARRTAEPLRSCV